MSKSKDDTTPQPKNKEEVFSEDKTYVIKKKGKEDSTLIVNYSEIVKKAIEGKKGEDFQEEKTSLIDISKFIKEGIKKGPAEEDTLLEKKEEPQPAIEFSKYETQIDGKEPDVVAKPARRKVTKKELIEKYPQIIILGTKLIGESKFLRKPTNNIGRSEENEIVIPNPSVSKKHAVIFEKDGNYIIKDLGSTNKTRVNNKIIDETILKNGDEILFGDVKSIFAIRGYDYDPLEKKLIKVIEEKEKEKKVINKYKEYVDKYKNPAAVIFVIFLCFFTVMLSLSEYMVPSQGVSSREKLNSVIEDIQDIAISAKIGYIHPIICNYFLRKSLKGNYIAKISYRCRYNPDEFVEDSFETIVYPNQVEPLLNSLRTFSEPGFFKFFYESINNLPFIGLKVKEYDPPRHYDVITVFTVTPSNEDNDIRILPYMMDNDIFSLEIGVSREDVKSRNYKDNVINLISSLDNKKILTQVEEEAAKKGGNAWLKKTKQTKRNKLKIMRRGFRDKAWRMLNELKEKS